MNTCLNFDEVFNSFLVKRVIRELFDGKEIVVLERPASFIIRLKREPEERVSRIILLPPEGFTANKVNEVNPHPEVRKARIIVKGGVRPKRHGFNFLSNVIKFAYFIKRDVGVEEDRIYARINHKDKFY
ncbi:hypothetical protein KJ660_01655, partial [Candidatus Micrarchaeota archaeon]|nr:hypothetical protein [Candidatus Micrarchaeota archaeon]